MFFDSTFDNLSTPTLLIDLHYLPSLEYFYYLLPYRTIRLEAQESYQKQSYRNRCYILTSQQVDRLTVPVNKGSSKVPYKSITIDYSHRWVNLHWRALCTAYNKAPYFEYLAECLHTIFLRKYTYLFDLNLALLQTCLQLLQLEKNIVLSEHYEKKPVGNVVDARYKITPNTRLAPSNYYPPVQYDQVFGKKFYPNLSIVDLLFCQGYHACNILQQ